MVFSIAANTIRLAVRSKVLLITMGMVTVLLWTAGFASWRVHQQLQHTRAAYNANVRSLWVDQPDRHPHRVSHYGYSAFRERSPLAFVDGGVDGYAGAAVFLEAHRQNPANFSEAGQSPATVRFGELNPALVLQMVVPLVIAFLGFSSVSGERENGTWVLLRAEGVPVRSLLLGKMLGLAVTTGAVVLPGLAGITLLALHSGGGLQPLRAILLALAYFSFWAVCVLFTVHVSASAPSSRAALTFLLAAWVTACVIAPRALQAWGTARWPTPSRTEFEALLERDLEHTGDSHNPDDPHFRQLRARVLAEHKAAKVEDLPFNYSALVMMEGEEISSTIFQRRYGQLIDAFRNQAAGLDAGAVWNPYVAIRRISMALCGTDLRHFIAFQRQTEAFRFAMVQHLNEIHLRQISQRNDRGQRVSRDNWRAFPQFRFQPPPLSLVLGEQAAPLAALAGWFVLLMAGVARRSQC